MEDIGLIFDLIKKAAAAEDMSGLLNLIDYKKTFVSLVVLPELKEENMS